MTEEEDQLARDVRETQEILRIAATTANSVADVGNALGFVRSIRERDEARRELAELRREVQAVIKDMEHWGTPRYIREQDQALGDIHDYREKLRAALTGTQEQS